MKYLPRFRLPALSWALASILLFLLGFTLLGCSSLAPLAGLGRGLAFACGLGDAAGVGFEDDPADDAAEQRPTVYVNIKNFRFNPSDIVVPEGTRVVFVNQDSVEHNILQSGTRRVGAEPPLFESPILGPGQQWGFVFTQPGEYPIVCTVNGHQLMGMLGRIIVTEPAVAQR